MPTIDVDDLLFDDLNESKFAEHRVTAEEVQQVLDGRPKFYRNRKGRRASHVMVGETFGGRLLVVPMEQIQPGLWRPVTAFEPSAGQDRTYRSRKP
jgi:hypothetical protein